MKLHVAAAAMVMTLGLQGPSNAAAPYPSKPIRVVITTGPGGASDVVARLVAQHLQARLEQSVLMEYKPGAAGSIAAQYAVRAPADGHTLLLAYPGPITVNPALDSNLPYNPLTDLEPVAILSRYSMMLVTNAKQDYRTLPEFVAAAKASPGKLNYGSSGGNGSSAHLSMELFKRAAGINLEHIQFKSTPEQSIALLAGWLAASFESPTTALAQIEAGKYRALGVSSAKRMANAQNIPTIAEQGFPGFEIGGWWALMAPAGTPKPIIAKLSGEIADIMKRPDMKEALLKLGQEADGTGPDEFRALIARETASMSKLVKDANIKADK